jgi:25S rRNA (uracil2634-N3)-methyltransferase
VERQYNTAWANTRPGDFSFARCLICHHHCKYVLATCYDSKEELHAKYPYVGDNLDVFLPRTSSLPPSTKLNININRNADTKAIEDGAGTETDTERKGIRDEQIAVETESKESKGSQTLPYSSSSATTRILYSIDARKLGANKDIRRGFPSRRQIPIWKAAQAQNQAQTRNRPAATQSIDSNGPWDTICFNFPHVGGLSTDVNRQVRANQELLVAYFNASKPLLSSAPAAGGDSDPDFDEDDDLSSSQTSERDSANRLETDCSAIAKKKRLTKGGQILVTLFEGEPYTLWNIKDLARHAGLRVVTSFQFPWSSYPGYSHARTTGTILGRNGAPGGWHGEDRLARTYVFEVCDGDHPTPGPEIRKRKRDDSESDD